MKHPSPIVFRIRDADLRKRLDKFMAVEALHVGYLITATEVVERALREWLEHKK